MTKATATTTLQARAVVRSEAPLTTNQTPSVQILPVINSTQELDHNKVQRNRLMHLEILNGGVRIASM